jgi:predicted RNA-binding Zn-ribbon protein involved in translation (DUF1610 family)
MTTELATVQAGGLPATVQAINSIKERMNLVTTVYKSIMEDGQDFGKIPGCGDKPTLLKPGAEKLMMAFRISATNEKVDVQDYPNMHRDYRVTVMLTSQGGEILGSGCGSCSTLESKYRYREASKKCPECGKEAIIKGKKEYGGGWLCFAKKGGCGAKFADGDKAIEEQFTGRVENPDPADQWNTVLKMAKKRALIDACLTCLGASTMFTQDIEDMNLGHQVGPTAAEAAEKLKKEDEKNAELAKQVRQGQKQAQKPAPEPQQPAKQEKAEQPHTEPVKQPVGAQRTFRDAFGELQAQAKLRGGKTLELLQALLNGYLTMVSKELDDCNDEDYKNIVETIRGTKDVK